MLETGPIKQDSYSPIGVVARSATCLRICLIFFLAALWPYSSWAQLDLQKVQREKLPNGLTLLVLQEHSFPSVSVQMLYRVGGRNEPAGLSGSAHFLEHMAFRASENFPDTDVVSQIYAAGGEWHGYTWIDQTTYFATVPSDQYELLLRIEADRMQRLLIEPRWMEPEKGAVLAEMHGYENDPAAVLHDAVVFAAFQAHPYRNNVIGWEADILALQHKDVLAFYRQHYTPANAVLAVVGDIDAEQVRQKVAQLFGEFPAAAATPLPHTIEPLQTGARRIELLGAGDASYFEIAYPAPAANDPDFPAMLVLQQWLSGGTGVNFMQEYGVSYAQPRTALYGKINALSTWFPPSAQRYLFSIRGTVTGDQKQRDVQKERAIDTLIKDVIQQVRDGHISDEALQHSKQRVQEELVYDLGSGEEAAHQLAFYDGLNALDEWLALPQKVAQVSNADLVALANRWLQPWQQTSGWYLAGSKPPITWPAQSPAESQLGVQLEQPADSLSPDSSADIVSSVEILSSVEIVSSTGKPSSTNTQNSPQTLPAPQFSLLDEGLPLLLQSNPASAAAYISLVLDGNQWQGSSYLQSNAPVWGVSSLSTHCLPDQLEKCLAILLTEADKLRPVSQTDLQSLNPATRLNGMFESMLGLESQVPTTAAVRLAVLAGKLPEQAMESVKTRLKRLKVARSVAQELVERPIEKSGQKSDQASAQQQSQVPLKDEVLEWPYALAQAQVGYVVKAPLPSASDFVAWRVLQYILAHDYEGRLGKLAISNSGLAYYIDSQYRSDGQRAWVSVSTGVDPAKLPALEQLFREQLKGLQLNPPGEAEVSEAKDHLIGRLATARQNNAELAGGLVEQWLWYGRLESKEDQIARIKELDRQEVLDAAPGFSRGAFAILKRGKK